MWAGGKRGNSLKAGVRMQRDWRKPKVWYSSCRTHYIPRLFSSGERFPLISLHLYKKAVGIQFSLHQIKVYMQKTDKCLHEDVNDLTTGTDNAFYTTRSISPFQPKPAHPMTDRFLLHRIPLPVQHVRPLDPRLFHPIR